MGFVNTTCSSQHQIIIPSLLVETCNTNIISLVFYHIKNYFGLSVVKTVVIITRQLGSTTGQINTEDGIKVILKDWGKKFDPAKISEPDFNVDIEDLQMRGLGLHLMKNLMDKIGDSTEEGKGNTLVMMKRK